MRTKAKMYIHTLSLHWPFWLFPTVGKCKGVRLYISFSGRSKTLPTKEHSKQHTACRVDIVVFRMLKMPLKVAVPFQGDNFVGQTLGVCSTGADVRLSLVFIHMSRFFLVSFRTRRRLSLFHNKSGNNWNFKSELLN